jgi:cytochrome P450
MFIPQITADIQHAIMRELPPCHGEYAKAIDISQNSNIRIDKWASVYAFEVTTRLVVHEFARISVTSLYDDPGWLHIQRVYPENVFKVVIQMRVVPKGLKRIASWILPSIWAVHRNLCQAKALVAPIVRHRRKLEASGDVGYEKPNDFLQWLMDEAWDERDGQPEALVHRMLVLALASVHTTSMTAAQVLFDLIAHPEYIQPLREEIIQAMHEEGGWKKTTLTKLRKLNSFMKESQRLNGPSLSELRITDVCAH